jgi:lipid-binding SYLF domain-containing protein
MLKVHRALRSSLLAAAATLASVLASPTSAANGTVYFEVVKAGFIVGVGRGSGTLVFNGRRYPLSVGGLSFGATIGASKTELIGTAYNLRHASDIAGTYTAVGAGVAVAGGGSSIRLQNARGVVLDLRGRNIGLEISANVSGVEISLR